MEKEIRIQVPEGYTIDKEQSTFEKIVFKPIPIIETYADIERILITDMQARVVDFKIPFASDDLFLSMMALRKLCNVAAYLNGDWTPAQSRYNQRWFIGLTFEDAKSDKVSINIMNHNSVKYSCVYFKNRSLAQKAIQILGEDVIIKALTLNH